MGYKGACIVVILPNLDHVCKEGSWTRMSRAAVAREVRTGLSDCFLPLTALPSHPSAMKTNAPAQIMLKVLIKILMIE